MTHLISPSAFRLGKSVLWKTNTIIKSSANVTSQNIALAATSLNGLPLILKHKLRRKRLLLVKTNIFKQNQILNCRLLFMPRIKTRPKSEGRGIFSQNVLYKYYNWRNPFQANTKWYIDQRRLKIFKFPQKKKIKQINKWLSRRMLRGSHSTFGFNIKRTAFFKPKKKYLRWIPRWINSNGLTLQNYYLHSFFNKTINYNNNLRFIRDRYIKLKYRWVRNFKSMQFKNRWYTSRLKMAKNINHTKLSHSISNILNQNCNIVTMNVFNYLAVKEMIGFRSHQNHLWNKKFRKHRFFYDNYYDIVNSFFILSLIKNSESLLLDILRIMMPRIRKIKRFMMFLDSILKHMPQIQTNFSCFRIIIAGKIRGGTQRTKILSIGFGRLPYQSISIEGSTAFVSYPHKYGEFGIKLIISRF